MRARRIVPALVVAAVAAGSPGAGWADTAVRGATDPVTAPHVRADGRPWSDFVPVGATRYYAVQVGRGQQVDARATLRAAGEAPDDACPAPFALEVLPPSLRSGPGTAWASFRGRTAATVFAGVPSGATDTAGTWWLRVTTAQGRCEDGSPLPPGPYPLELSVSAVGGAPAPAAPGEVPLPGGSSPAFAPLLPVDGAPVLGDLAPGETRWWRIGDGGTARASVVVGGVPWNGRPCPAVVRTALLDGRTVGTADAAQFDGRQPAATAPAPGRGRYLEVSLAQGECVGGRAIPDRRYPVRLAVEVTGGEPLTPARAAVRRFASEPVRVVWSLSGVATLATLLGMLVFAAVRFLGAVPPGAPPMPGGPGWGTPDRGGLSPRVAPQPEVRRRIDVWPVEVRREEPEPEPEPEPLPEPEPEREALPEPEPEPLPEPEPEREALPEPEPAPPPPAPRPPVPPPDDGLYHRPVR